MRFPISLLLTLLLSAGCVSTPPNSPAEELTQPNILFAIADDWSWPHAGTYGDPVVKTPVFDRISSEGFLFENAFVSSPSCTPSRAAVLTGQWHWRLKESANLWSTLQADIPVYPDLLEAAGYFVGHTRKGWGPGLVEPGGRTRNPAGPIFEDFSEFLSKRPDGNPFCFWFGSTDPHRGYTKDSGIDSGIEAEKIELFSCFPDSPAVRGDVADYYLEVQRFDREIGEMLKALEEIGELENTIVVITSDNGMPFPRCKANLYDSGVHVPLAISWPSRLKNSGVVADFVSLTDLAPTFLELAGVAIPSEMTGRSLLPILEPDSYGPVREARDFVLVGKERHVPCQEEPISGGTPMRAIRTAEYLYIRNFEPDRWPAGTPNYEKAFFPGSWYGDVDNGPTKTYMLDNKDKDALHQQLFELAFSKRPAEELYDLSKDSEQLTNLASDPEYQSIKEDLSEKLMDALRKSSDPRVEGNGPVLETYPYHGGSPLAPGYKPEG